MLIFVVFFYNISKSEATNSLANSVIEESNLQPFFRFNKTKKKKKKEEIETKSSLIDKKDLKDLLIYLLCTLTVSR